MVKADHGFGLYHAGLLSGIKDYFAAASQVWQFINQHLIDHEVGEWYWGVDENGAIMAHEDKAGFWKCPYHNSRSCLQMLHLLKINHVIS